MPSVPRRVYLSRDDAEGNLLHHAPGLKGAIHNEFGMQAAEGFGHVAIPANGLVFGKNVGKLLGTKLPPLARLGIGP